MAKKGEKSPHRMVPLAPRPSSIQFTPDKKIKFLRLYSQTGNISGTAKIMGVSTKTVYNHQGADPEFKSRCGEAWETYLDSIEESVGERARGFFNGSKMVYSDTAAALLLNAHRSDIFRRPDRVQVEHKHQVEVSLELPAPVMDILNLALGPDAPTKAIDCTPKSLIDDKPPAQE